MSGLAKLALATSCTFAVGIISYVHYKQKSDKARLHEGVIKDLNRQEMRKIENTKRLQEQIELTKRLKIERDKTLGSEDVKT